MFGGALERMHAVGELALDGLAAALLSSPCASCGRVALRVRSGAICEECWRSVSLLTPPLCARCGAALTAMRSEVAMCPGAAPAARTVSIPVPAAVDCTCDDLPGSVDVARAVGPYEGTLRSAIHALKYDRRRSLAPRLARLAAEHCASILQGADAIVPVPLHARRRWIRGFNQSEEIARHLPLPLWRVLRRARHTAPQAGLSGHARARNLAGAFAARRWIRRSRVDGACLVLLDDVSTTGATLAACAEVLRDMGAGEVRALTIARTLRTAAIRL